MKTRKTFSVMLVICMLLSLVFPSSGGGCQMQPQLLIR